MSDSASTASPRNIVVAGCNAEAAAVAAALAISLQGSDVRITLVAALDGQSSVGVERIRGGEQAFHRQLGINERELMQETAAVYALGTQFNGFVSGRDRIFVPTGSHGLTLRLLPFHQYWCNRQAAGNDDEYNEYSLPAMAAARGRFVPAKQSDDPVQATLAYDILVDPDLYAHFYRDVARKFGVALLRDSVTAAIVGPDGCIEQVRLASGKQLAGDFFVDCSDARPMIGSLAGNDFDDWSTCLPVDRLHSVLTGKQRDPALFVAMQALAEGWQQRNALQNFTVETLACCSGDIGDDDAKTLLGKNLQNAPLSSVATRALNSGRYRRPWLRNCVAIGPAALAVEQINVSSLQLAQNAAMRLLGMLPAGKDSPMLAREFNRVTAEEHAGIRDFAILHYHLADRPAVAFWSRSRKLPLPESLQQRLELYKETGRLNAGENEWFGDADWLSCLINFGSLPKSCDPLVAMADQERIDGSLQAFRQAVRAACET